MIDPLFGNIEAFDSFVEALKNQHKTMNALLFAKLKAAVDEADQKLRRI